MQSPQFKFVGLLSESITRRQLDYFAKEDVDDCGAELFKQDADGALADAKRPSNDIVLVFGSQQSQGDGNSFLQRYVQLHISVLLG